MRWLYMVASTVGGLTVAPACETIQRKKLSNIFITQQRPRNLSSFWGQTNEKLLDFCDSCWRVDGSRRGTDCGNRVSLSRHIRFHGKQVRQRRIGQHRCRQWQWPSTGQRYNAPG